MAPIFLQEFLHVLDICADHDKFSSIVTPRQVEEEKNLTNSSSPRMLLSFVTCSYSVQFLNVLHNN